MTNYEIQEAGSTDNVEGCRPRQILIVSGRIASKRTILKAFDDARAIRRPAKIPHLQRGGFNRWPGKKNPR